MVVHIPGFNLPLTAASGQSFRFNHFQDTAYELIAMSQRLIIKHIGQDLYDFSCDEKHFMAVWQKYFDLERDYETVRSLVPQDGSYLHQAVKYASGVRILRQEPFENLVVRLSPQNHQQSWWERKALAIRNLLCYNRFGLATAVKAKEVCHRR